eukprot:PhF_6_TR33583/c0_g1_i1/m.49011
MQHQTFAIASVASWQDKLMEAAEDSTTTGIPSESTIIHFPVNTDINSRVALLLGAAHRVQCDAIVNPVEESFGEVRPNTPSYEIQQTAGEAMIREVRHILAQSGTTKGRTGEAIVTGGYDLPTRHVIHTIGPRYSDKYQNAALNMLHACYRACLVQCVANKCRTMCIPPIHSDIKGFTATHAVHVVLRTIRRYLERFHTEIDKIVLCFYRLEDYEVYVNAMPYYYPRSPAELKKFPQSTLGEDIGGPNGEVALSDRSIRITASPGSTSTMVAPNSNLSFTSSSPSTTLLGSGHVLDMTGRASRTMVTNLRGDPDQRSSSPRSIAYEAFNHSAVLANQVEWLPYANWFYRSGIDDYGRVILVGLGYHIPAASEGVIDWDKMRLHVIRILHKMGPEQEFVFVYIDGSGENPPAFSWLRGLYEVLPMGYRRNVRAVYIVKPSFWHWAFVAAAKPFLSSKIWQRVFTLKSVVELGNVMPLSQLVLPDDIWRDMS